MCTRKFGRPDSILLPAAVRGQAYFAAATLSTYLCPSSLVIPQSEIHIPGQISKEIHLYSTRISLSVSISISIIYTISIESIRYSQNNMSCPIICHIMQVSYGGYTRTIVFTDGHDLDDLVVPPGNLHISDPLADFPRKPRTWQPPPPATLQRKLRRPCGPGARKPGLNRGTGG